MLPQSIPEGLEVTVPVPVAEADLVTERMWLDGGGGAQGEEVYWSLRNG